MFSDACLVRILARLVCPLDFTRGSWSSGDGSRPPLCRCWPAVRPRAAVAPQLPPAPLALVTITVETNNILLPHYYYYHHNHQHHRHPTPR